MTEKKDPMNEQNELLAGVGPYNSAQFKTRFMVGVPTTGLIRYEWAVGRYTATTPVHINTASRTSTPANPSR